MAAGSLTAAALRHRPRQALLIAILAAVVSGSAVLGPLYSRAVEQSVLRTVLSEAPAATRGLTVLSTGNQPPAPERITAALAIDSAQLGTPIGGLETAVAVRPAPGSTGNRLRGSSVLVSRDALCAHLTLAAGSCNGTRAQPATRAQPGVLVSRRNAATFGVTVGDRVTLADGNEPTTTFVATVTGLYEPFDPTTTYWFGRASDAANLPASSGSQSDRPTALDAVYTSAAVLRGHQWALLRTHVDVPLAVDRLTLSDLPRLSATTQQLEARARTVDAAVTTGLPDLLAAVDRQRRQTRTVIPLLAVQLALLGVVVLGFVCAAATEARRPEVALARLRGQRSLGAASLLLRELGLLVVIGGLVGVGLGALVARASTDVWLASGTSLELTGAVLVAAVAAVVVGLLAVSVTALPTLRQPLTSLLRRVPPRASALQVGVVEGALVAATGAGVVTLLSASRDGNGGSQGPVALLAPGLLAVAGGLLLAQVVVPVAGPLARRALSRGRVAGALAATQVARRPALRRLIAIVTVACALLVFAVDTWEVAGRHRSALAGVEAGAPVVLSVSARDARTLHDAVLAADPRERFATPVVTAGNLASSATRTTAVDPEAFARIARWGGADRRPATAALTRLRSARVAPLVVTGRRIEADVTADVSPSVQKNPLPLRPSRLVLHLTTRRERTSVTVNLGVLHNDTRTYVGAMPCATGCLLRQVEVRRTFGDFKDADINVAMTRVRVGSTTRAATEPVDLGPPNATAWQSVTDDFGADEVAVQPKAPLTFVGTSFGESVFVQRGDVPVTPRALVTGNIVERDPAGASTGHASAPDLAGIESLYRVEGRLPLVPRTGDRGVLVDLDEIADAAGPPTSLSGFTVWLAADDAARERALVGRLRAQGVVVTGRDTEAQRAQALSRQGPTLALRLALLAGVVALVLAAAALPIGAATSGANRSRDLAALRIVGVPARAIRAATVREHLVVAVLGTVAGVTLGLLAAQAALPQVPLFVGPAPRLPVVLRPAWTPVVLAALAALALLVVTSVLVGRSLAGAARPGQLRSGR